MEFLVRIEVSIPPDMDAQRRRDLFAAELAYGRGLRAQGVITRIWRLPGGLRNVGVWCAADATELHELVAALPLYPWATTEVTALAVHPLERD